MKLVAIIRPSATVTVQGAGIGVDELRAAVLEQQPAGYALAQLLVGSGRVDGNLTGTGVFRPSTTTTLEADGRDYQTARTTLNALIPADHQLLSVRAID